jgi:hypothetical protein
VDKIKAQRERKTAGFIFVDPRAGYPAHYRKLMLIFGDDQNLGRHALVCCRSSDARFHEVFWLPLNRPPLDETLCTRRLEELPRPGMDTDTSCSVLSWGFSLRAMQSIPP